MSVRDNSLTLSAPVLLLLEEHVENLSNPGELGTAVSLLKDVINQSVRAMTSAMLERRGVSTLTHLSDADRQALYTLRGLLDITDDADAKERYGVYWRHNGRDPYAVWYQKYIAPPPPAPPPEERVYAALEALKETPLAAGLRLAWRSAESQAQREAVATMAETLVRTAQPEVTDAG